MRRAIFSCTVLFFVVLTMPVQGQFEPVNSTLEFEFGGQSFDPDGTVRTSGGNPIDLDSDLNVERDEAPTLGVRYQPESTRGFRARWSRFSFTGNSTLNSSITYSGKSFSGGSNVSTEMDVQFLSFDFLYRLTRFSRRDFFNLAIGGRVIEYDGTLTGSGKTATEEITTVSPTVGLDFRKYLAPKVYFSGRVNGMDATVDDNEFSLVDAEAGVGVRLLRDFWINGGYRVYNLDVNHDGDALDAEFDGLHAAARVYF